MARKIGFHLSIAGGVWNAIDHAAELGTDSLQIFLKNSNRWTAPPLREDDIITFREKWNEYRELSIHAHTGYLINLAGEGENLEKSAALMKDEIQRAGILSVPDLVLHPGNHKGAGEGEGIRRIVKNLDSVLLESPGEVEILLETTAGQGTSVGHRFEHIRDIIAGSSCSGRLGVCLDTCHVFAAGYDISTPEGYENTISEFDELIGLDRLKLIHMNDSKKAAGSRVDRHEHIGKGFIGGDCFRLLLNDPRLDHADFVMETPVDEAYGNRENLAFVRALLNRKNQE